MATSGTTAFTLDFGEVTEEAYELCGLESRTGYDLKTARRSADLLFLEWKNIGLNIWKIIAGSQALTAGDYDYTLPSNVVDVTDAVIRTGSGTSTLDSPVDRSKRKDWVQIANKMQTGKPSQMLVDILTAGVTVNLWPVPDGVEPYTFIYYGIRRIEDSGPGGAYNPDMPARYLPALVNGLAAKLAIKKAPERLDMLTRLYKEALTDAISSDPERDGFQIQPMIYD